MGFIAEIESDPRLNLKMQIESRLTATKYKKRKANEGEDKDKEYEYDRLRQVRRHARGQGHKAQGGVGLWRRRLRVQAALQVQELLTHDYQHIREDDPSDELECRDVGKACLPPPKKKRKN